MLHIHKCVHFYIVLIFLKHQEHLKKSLCVPTLNQELDELHIYLLVDVCVAPDQFTVIGSLDKQCHVKYLLTIFWWKGLLHVSISPGVVSVVMLNDDIINMS